MSLDLYIISNKPVKHKGTGIIIRQGGETKELTTLDEVNTYFPDIDISNIDEIEYENDIVWHEKLTHNLGLMAKNVPINPFTNKTLYDYLWHPNTIGFKHVDQEYIDSIKVGYDYLKENKENLEKFNPPNGWGKYETLLKFVKSLNECLQNLIIEFSDDYTIVSDV